MQVPALAWLAVPPYVTYLTLCLLAMPLLTAALLLLGGVRPFHALGFRALGLRRSLCYVSPTL